MEIEPIGRQQTPGTGGQDAIRESSAVQYTRMQQASSRPPAAGPPSTDSVEISDASRELARAQQAVEDAPDVREDKVADIKQRIADGTYNVPAEALADKLLGEG